MQTIDLNCDMGESTALWAYHADNDKALFPYISSANIACGFHAGDAYTMHELVDAALEAGVAIGAHPGFADRDNFGRTNMPLTPEEIYNIILYQLGALEAFLNINGTRLHHVKPHGALYNMAAIDQAAASAVCRAVKDYNAQLILYALSGSKMIEAAAAIGLTCCSEVFADRTYQPDGSLTHRSRPDALITNEDQCVQQVLQMVMQGTVPTLDRLSVPVKAGTVCLHADGGQALTFAKKIHQTLKQHGIEIKPV